MRRLTLCVLALSVLVPAGSPGAERKPKRAKNVILLLADAGGIPTINAASLYGYNAPQKLFIQSWEHIGLSDTSPTARWVSDSAAGMTALVTGSKTFNGVISQAPDGVRGKKDGTTLKTVLEYAEEKGLSTGVITNMPIADATPAACYAHSNDRGKWGEIFLQVFSPRFGDGVDMLIGAGRKRIWEQVQALNKDPEAIAKEHGRPIYSSLAEIPADAKRALMVTDGEFSLSDATKRTVASLAKNPKGYFLMIEWDAHTDKIEAGLSRLVTFDKVIKELAETVNLDDTLLLFTADHSFDLRVDAGGPDNPLLKPSDKPAEGPVNKREVRLAYVRMADTHTGEEVLVAAKGAGAERVRGFFPNTQVFHIMMDAYGWKESR